MITRPLKDIIHENIESSSQGCALILDNLRAQVQETKRRYKNVNKSIRLFGQHEKLTEKLKLFESIRQDINNEIFWLIRPCSLGALLTVDHVKYDMEREGWVTGSHRFALTMAGWRLVNANLRLKDIPDLIPLYEFVESIPAKEFLDFLVKFSLDESMMLSPRDLMHDADAANKLKI